MNRREALQSIVGTTALASMGVAEAHDPPGVSASKLRAKWLYLVADDFVYALTNHQPTPPLPERAFADEEERRTVAAVAAHVREAGRYSREDDAAFEEISDGAGNILDSGRRQSARGASFLVLREPRALLRAARQLVVAVRQFDAPVVQLEAQGHAGIRGIEPRQSGLRSGIAMQEGQ